MKCKCLANFILKARAVTCVSNLNLLYTCPIRNEFNQTNTITHALWWNTPIVIWVNPWQCCHLWTNQVNMDLTPIGLYIMHIYTCIILHQQCIYWGNSTLIIHVHTLIKKLTNMFNCSNITHLVRSGHWTSFANKDPFLDIQWSTKCHILELVEVFITFWSSHWHKILGI